MNMLYADLTKVKQIAVALARGTPDGGKDSSDKEHILMPENFDSTRFKLQSFLIQLRLKVASYPKEQTKLRLVVNCLIGDAIDQVQSYVENDKVNLANLAALIGILDTAFGNPNRVAEAKSKLSTLQQGTRDFMLYYTEFQRYATDVQWDEVAKLAALKKRLSYRLKNDFVMTATDPAIVADLVPLCNYLNMCHRTLQSESQAPNTIPCTGAIASVMASTSSGIAPNLMDLSANRPRLMAEE